MFHGKPPVGWKSRSNLSKPPTGGPVKQHFLDKATFSAKALLLVRHVRRWARKAQKSASTAAAGFRLAPPCDAITIE
jgi:hypothetical protein